MLAEQDLVKNRDKSSKLKALSNLKNSILEPDWRRHASRLTNLSLAKNEPKRKKYYEKARRTSRGLLLRLSHVSKRLRFA